MNGIWLNALVPALLTGLVLRALWVVVAVETSARFLLNPPTPEDDPADVPWLVILLPMLREQSVADETITAFTRLDHPSDRALVVVITTEREETTRSHRRSRLPELATRQLDAADLHGLFPTTRCQVIADTVNNTPPHARLEQLTILYDAEPTTAQIVDNLITRNKPGQLRVAHLHQPDTGGRKAGQLNHALEHLGTLLTPLGWNDREHADTTYTLVYDADALPDTHTLTSFAATIHDHHRRTGTRPALVQQQRLPLLARRPFPPGAAGLLLTGEWVYQLRRSLGIELARIRLHHRLATTRLPHTVRTALRPMVYAVGCGMAVHLPAVHALGGFPEPMEDLGTGHRLSLLGAPLTASPTAVLDEPYTDTAGLLNLHALAFTASARPDLHARAVAHLPSALSRTARTTLVLREWTDEAAWLLGAPLTTAAVASSWWAGPIWTIVAMLGVLLHGPLLTARLLRLTPALHAGVAPPAGLPTPPLTAACHPLLVIAASPFQPFVRLAGPWRLIWRKTIRRPGVFGKTER